MRTRLVWLLGSLCGLSTLAAALLPARPAHASVSEALDLRQLVHASHEIVVGVTRSAQARYDGARIVTDSVVEVEDRMRGGVAPTLRVTTLGGAVGDVGMRVEGSAHLDVGDRALLFLRRGHGAQVLTPVGMAQGVLPVNQDQRGQDVVFPGARGLALMRRVGGGRLVPAPAALMEPRPLHELCAEIEALVAVDEAP
ncbi:MAG: hypothetical protein H6725_17635 [Sandaracinaceae bacterium]|nr:hypothetical protein [Sandaracinaceae bacterium]